MQLDQPAQQPDQRDEIRASRPAMTEQPQGRAVPGRIEPADEARRRGPQDLAHGLDRRDHGCDAPKRETGCNERDEFPVFNSRVTANDLDRIERGFGMIEGEIQIVQRRPKGCCSHENDPRRRQNAVIGCPALHIGHS